MAASSYSAPWQLLPAPRIVRWSLAACAVAAGLGVLALAADLGPSPFHPHGYCFLWDPTLVGLNVGADLAIGLSYLAISGTLLFLVRRARGMLPFSWLFVAFGLFIVSCGLTHFMDVVTLWYPAFWLSADVRVITALASIATAVALPRTLPSVIEVLRSAKMAHERRDELERSHAALEEHATARSADLAAVQHRQRLLEDQLRQAQKLEAVGRLASGVAHDFNNLITAMLGYSELIGPHLAQDDRRGQLYLTEIHNAAERASQLTRQLLAFSRRQMLEPQEISLDDLVRNAKRMLERVIGEDIHLVVRTGQEAIRVYADPGQIEQVLMNLVVNARHAMPEGGTLTIETGVRDVPGAGGTEVLALPAGRYASVTVSDTGTGIPPEVLPHIFEPFFTTKGEAGTGLGLATVYGIVKQSGGDVQIETRLDAGTTVRVLLPTIAA